jgi:mono/diheme cytochrome c family protein
MSAAVRAQARAAAEARKADAQLARAMEQGRTIFEQLCYTCHGIDGKGTPIPDNPAQTLAPSMVKAPRIVGSGSTMVRTILHGLTGPLDGKTYPGVMAPMNSQNDQWIADVATYIRNSFGNEASPITPEFVAALRRESAGRTTPWTLEELEALDPPALVNRREWKLTASHNRRGCRAAIDGNGGSRWDTSASQEGGEWFQIELPRVSKLSEITLDARGSDRDYPLGYEVTVSLDGKEWSEPVAKGAGTIPLTVIGLPLPEAKFLRITQTGAVNGLFWSIHELQIKGKER